MWKPISRLPKTKMQILVTDQDLDEPDDPRFPGYYSNIELINWPPTPDGKVMCQNTGNYQSIWFTHWMEVPERLFKND